jgi:hypothetical protein
MSACSKKKKSTSSAPPCFHLSRTSSQDFFIEFFLFSNSQLHNCFVLVFRTLSLSLPGNRRLQ